jgi:hypothetical protein
VKPEEAFPALGEYRLQARLNRLSRSCNDHVQLGHFAAAHAVRSEGCCDSSFFDGFGIRAPRRDRLLSRLSDRLPFLGVVLQ